MSQAAWIYENQEARLLTGRVVRALEGRYQVLAGAGSREAVPAASCLLLPALHDTVLLADLAGGTAVIVAVLFRQEDAPASLRLPAESDLVCAGGLTLRAGRALALQSAQALRLEARETDLISVNVTARMLDLTSQIDVGNVCCRELTSLGEKAVSAFASVSQCMGTSRRLVEESDETHCADSTLVAGESATVMSRNSLQLTEETARIDAKLIQMG